MTRSKYEGGTGKGQSAQLDRHPRVMAYDDGGTDDGHRFITLAKGYAFYDAADPGQDPDGKSACHCGAYGTVKEALDAIDNAEPCHCGRCIS